jgi:catechol 2,3-dioxygenase-like lactoylglutathione lyase family enzyme
LSVELNHTIVHARDNRESAEFFAELLGLEISGEWGPFVAVGLSNGVTLDFATIPEDRITPQHYAFLVSEEEFDAAYTRIRQRGIEHWADPQRQRPGAVNRNDGGRGVYFLDPAGHYLELITVPYGGRPSS